MQNIGNKLKNVLVNNNMGKTHQNPSTSTASAVLTTTLKPTPRSNFHLEQKPKPKDSKPLTPHMDLSGKLDFKGKLTQQEWQRWIDKNLCLFCGGSGHQTDICLVNSTRGHAATTESVPSLLKPKESGSNKKKTRQSIGVSTAGKIATAPVLIGLWS
jgi:hypothetical protein